MPLLLATAALFAAWAFAWRALARSGHAVLHGIDAGQVLRERALKLGSGLVSAAAVVGLALALVPPAAPVDAFAVHGSWLVGLVFHVILWIALAGQLHLLGCVLVLGGYVAEAGPGAPRGDPGQQLMGAGARAATALANERPVVALHSFLVAGLLCVAGLALASDRQVRSTDAGLAHDGFWNLTETVEPWEHMARLRVLRDPDSDKGPDGPWQLRWERADGSSALHLEADAYWDLDRETLDRVVAWHNARGVPVDDPRRP